MNHPLSALIVDDETHPRKILKDFVPWDELGFSQVLEADGGASALDIALYHKPHLIISDIKMPDMDGILLAEAVRKQLPLCRFILLSGYSDKQYLKSAIKLKVEHYLEKPIDLQEVTSAVKGIAEELQYADQEAEMSAEMAEQWLGISLLDPENAGVDMLQKLASLRPQFLPEEPCFTAVIKLAGMEIGGKSDALSAMLRESLAELQSGCLLAFKAEDCIVVHGTSASLDFKKAVEAALRQFSETAYRYYGRYTAFIAIGDTVSSATDLHRSYQTAAAAMKKHFFRGGRGLVWHSSHAGKVYNPDPSVLSRLEKLLLSGELEQAKQLLLQTGAMMRGCEHTEPEVIRSVFFRMAYLVVSAADTRNLPAVHERSDQLVYRIARHLTLDDLLGDMLGVLDFFEEQLRASDSSLDSLARLNKYVYDHYCDEDISIASIAENLNLTSTYLCLLFKRSTGKTINQHITALRMTRAKELLKQPGRKVHEVAGLVGYRDVKYFTKVFAGAYGLRPKQYQESRSHD